MGKGSDEAWVDGSEIAAVAGVFGLTVGLVAEVGGYGEPFELRPVCGKGVEGGEGGGGEVGAVGVGQVFLGLVADAEGGEGPGRVGRDFEDFQCHGVFVDCWRGPVQECSLQEARLGRRPVSISCVDREGRVGGAIEHAHIQAVENLHPHCHVCFLSPYAKRVRIVAEGDRGRSTCGIEIRCLLGRDGRIVDGRVQGGIIVGLSYYGRNWSQL